ncbi:MAG: hypothetical protein AABX29_03620, partial [Nanoarchaeota archaeon]
ASVFSQVNNPVLREQSILSQCSVGAKSDSDTIKVVLKTSQSDLVGIFLYDNSIEGDFGGSQIALLQKSNNNIYKFIYQNKQYTTTEPKNLDEIVYPDGRKICYIDEPDKTGQRASTQEEINVCGYLVGTFPGSCQYRINDREESEINNELGQKGESPLGTDQIQYNMPITSGNCPSTTCWDLCQAVRISLCQTTTETEEPTPLPPPEVQEPTKCEEITNPTKCDSSNLDSSNLNCEWIGSRQKIPPECSGDALSGSLYSVFRFFTNIFANILGFFLKIILFIPNLLVLDAQVPDFATTVDCSQYQNQNSVWSGGISSIDTPGHCEDVSVCEDEDSPIFSCGLEDLCSDSSTLKERYYGQNCEVLEKEIKCSDEGKQCIRGSCQEVDAEDLKKFNQIIGDYQKVLEETSEFAKKRKEIENMKAVFPYDMDNIAGARLRIANEVMVDLRSRNIPTRLIEIKKYFEEYNRKSSGGDIYTELEIAKITSMLAMFESIMTMFDSSAITKSSSSGNVLLRPEQVNYGEVYKYYNDARDKIEELYSKIGASDLSELDKNFIMSDLLVTRSTLYLNAPEIFKHGQFKMQESFRDPLYRTEASDLSPSIEVILNSIGQAIKLNPLNAEAREIQKQIKISILRSIEGRINTEIKDITNEPSLQKFFISLVKDNPAYLTPEYSKAYQEEYLYLITTGHPSDPDPNNYGWIANVWLHHPINRIRTKLASESIKDAQQVAIAKGIYQKSVVESIKFLESLGFDIAEYKSKTGFSDRIVYINNLYSSCSNFVSSEELARGIDDITNPSSEFFNPDVYLLSRDGLISIDEKNVYDSIVERYGPWLPANPDRIELQHIPNPSFRFVLGRGYLSQKALERQWHDSVIGQLDDISWVIPLAQISKASATRMLNLRTKAVVKNLETISEAQNRGFLKVEPVAGEINLEGNAGKVERLRVIEVNLEINNLGKCSEMSRIQINNHQLNSLNKLLDAPPTVSELIYRKTLEDLKKQISSILADQQISMIRIGPTGRPIKLFDDITNKVFDKMQGRDIKFSEALDQALKEILTPEELARIKINAETISDLDNLLSEQMNFRFGIEYSQEKIGLQLGAQTETLELPQQPTFLETFNPINRAPRTYPDFSEWASAFTERPITNNNLYDIITKENIQEVFQNDLFWLGSKIYGGKAIVYLDSSGVYNVVFLTETSHTHHRLALGYRVKLEGKADLGNKIALEQFSDEQVQDILKRSWGFEMQYDISPQVEKIIKIEHSSQITNWQLGEHHATEFSFTKKQIEDAENALLQKIDSRLLSEEIGAKLNNLETICIDRDEITSLISQ